MNRFEDGLQNDKSIVTGWTSIQDTLYLSELAQTDFDAITLDMQHGMQTEDSVIRGIAAIAPSGKPVVIRIPVGRFDFASKALDAGAHAIIAPMINTVEDAQKLVSFTKYIPVGDRSFGPSQVSSVWKCDKIDYVKSANRTTKNFAMIETKQAVENMEAILDVEGIDGVFCGPADLSISVRGDVTPDPYGKDTIEIVEAMANAAVSRGKIAGAFCITTDHLEMCNKMGYRFMAYGFDSVYLAQGINNNLSQLSFR